jgi:hypothetical protein
MTADRPATKCDFTLEPDAWGHLVLVDGAGQRTTGVTPMRAFPVSDPDHWISICDAAGYEIICIVNWSEVTPEVRAVLEEELKQTAGRAPSRSTAKRTSAAWRHTRLRFSIRTESAT